MHNTQVTVCIYPLTNVVSNAVMIESQEDTPAPVDPGWYDITSYPQAIDTMGQTYLNRKAVSYDPLVFEMTTLYDVQTGEPLPLPPYLVTSAQFWLRFTQGERIATRTLAKTDAATEDFVTLVDLSGMVDVDVDWCVNGLTHLVTAAILTTDRVAQIRMHL